MLGVVCSCCILKTAKDVLCSLGLFILIKSGNTAGCLARISCTIKSNTERAVFTAEARNISAEVTRQVRDTTPLCIAHLWEGFHWPSRLLCTIHQMFLILLYQAPLISLSLRVVSTQITWEMSILIRNFRWSFFPECFMSKLKPQLQGWSGHTMRSQPQMLSI